jgi:xylan 1,4-beta-xylosidase
LIDPDKTGGMKSFQLIFDKVRLDAAVTVQRVDKEHGNTLAAYRDLGSPLYPTEEQVRRMNAATALPAPEKRSLEAGHLNLELEPNALVLVQLQP